MILQNRTSLMLALTTAITLNVFQSTSAAAQSREMPDENEDSHPNVYATEDSQLDNNPSRINPEERSRKIYQAGRTLLITGGVLLSTGIILGSIVATKTKEHIRSDCNGGTSCTEDSNKTGDRLKSMAYTTDLFIITSIPAIVLGVIFYKMGRSKKERAIHFTPNITGSSMGINFNASF